jgi:hypothetical protein
MLHYLPSHRSHTSSLWSVTCMQLSVCTHRHLSGCVHGRMVSLIGWPVLPASSCLTRTNQVAASRCQRSRPLHVGFTAMISALVLLCTAHTSVTDNVHFMCADALLRGHHSEVHVLSGRKLLQSASPVPKQPTDDQGGLPTTTEVCIKGSQGHHPAQNRSISVQGSQRWLQQCQ